LWKISTGTINSTFIKQHATGGYVEWTIRCRHSWTTALVNLLLLRTFPIWVGHNKFLTVLAKKLSGMGYTGPASRPDRGEYPIIRFIYLSIFLIRTSTIYTFLSCDPRYCRAVS
jgi:hypothetical protein